MRKRIIMAVILCFFGGIACFYASNNHEETVLQDIEVKIDTQTSEEINIERDAQNTEIISQNVTEQVSDDSQEVCEEEDEYANLAIADVRRIAHIILENL